MLFLLLLYNLSLSISLLWMMAKNPRFMLHDYPPGIIAQVPPQTAEEKQAAYRYGMPFMLILLVFPLVAGFVFKYSCNFSFLQVFLRVFELIFSFNLIDLLILDWLLFCRLTLKLFVIPGTEGHPAYKDYRFHFIGFLKGTLISLIGALVYAGLIEAVYVLF